jgi:hypothetical protein
MKSRFIALAMAVVFIALAGGFIAGERYTTDSAESTVEVARQAYEERTAVDEHNNEIFGQYLDGIISQEEANFQMLAGTRRTAHVALKQLKGTVTFGVYDPAGDPHARPGSRFGEKSCVIPKGGNEYNCGEDPNAKVQCVIYATFSDGVMKGTIFYGKSCDGLPICKLMKSGDEVVITYDYSRFVPAK